MARDSQDREDLLRDATAMKNRVQIEVRTRERTTEVFAGFRSHGQASLYFDQDPVYHFNSQGELRRAFVEDRLIKAEQGKLIVWLPQRSASEVAMRRQELTASEQTGLCTTIEKKLGELRRSLASGNYVVVGQVTEAKEGDVVKQLADFLEASKKVVVAKSPHVDR